MKRRRWINRLCQSKQGQFFSYVSFQREQACSVEFSEFIHHCIVVWGKSLKDIQTAGTNVDSWFSLKLFQPSILQNL